MTEGILIDVDCPHCGDVALGTDQVWLVLADAPGRSRYSFHCPSCSTLVSHVPSAAAVQVLVNLVAVEELAVPAEALERHDAPPLTVDDLLDLMLALHRQHPFAPAV